MTNQTKIPKEGKGEKTRRTPNVKLTAEERQALITLWTEYHGGIKAFAKRMAEIENPEAARSPSVNLTNTVNAKKRTLQRIEDGETGVSEDVFKTVADVFDISTAKLKKRLTAPASDKRLFYKSVPWVTDEEVIKQYRGPLHHYHQTKQGDDIFWIYTPIDFTTPHSGYLYASILIGMKGEINAHAYGYLFRQMLALMIKTVDEGYHRESILLYHDFRQKARDSIGHVGVLLNEDWDGMVGFSGGLLFDKAFPGTGAPGRQTSAICETLSEYWRVLDGERCNRILHLFGVDPYTRPPGSLTKLRKAVNLSEGTP